MTRGKLKFDWSVYSARRNVTVKLLQDKGIVTNYSTYVAYCDDMSVNPMSEADFNLQFTPPAHPDSTPPPEAPTIEATVWLAGVTDEQPKVASRDTIPPPKKKKSRDSAPEGSA